MRGKYRLYVDQYGNQIGARSITELRRRCGGGRVSKMYVDRFSPKTGKTKAFHTGYVVGSRWFTAFIPLEVPA